MATIANIACAQAVGKGPIKYIPHLAWQGSDDRRQGLQVLFRIVGKTLTFVTFFLNTSTEAESAKPGTEIKTEANEDPGTQGMGRGKRKKFQKHTVRRGSILGRALIRLLGKHTLIYAKI